MPVRVDVFNCLVIYMLFLSPTAVGYLGAKERNSSSILLAPTKIKTSDMKKCKDCKRFKPISYAGGNNIYPYCNQEHTYEPCSGRKCDYPDMYEQKTK